MVNIKGEDLIILIPIVIFFYYNSKMGIHASNIVRNSTKSRTELTTIGLDKRSNPNFFRQKY